MEAFWDIDESIMKIIQKLFHAHYCSLVTFLIYRETLGVKIETLGFKSLRKVLGWNAAYGMHTSSGKSYTGCAIVLGDVGALFCKSTKQKIVTKSSTEAELVGLSDTATKRRDMK